MKRINRNQMPEGGKHFSRLRKGNGCCGSNWGIYWIHFKNNGTEGSPCHATWCRIGWYGKSRSLRHFFCKKNGEGRRKASLHCAVRHNFTQKTKFFLHIFTELQRSLACEVAPCGRLWRRFAYAPLVKLPPVGGWMCFWLKAHLRCLNGGKPPWFFLLHRHFVAKDYWLLRTSTDNLRTAVWQGVRNRP